MTLKTHTQIEHTMKDEKAEVYFLLSLMMLKIIKTNTETHTNTIYRQIEEILIIN